MNVHENPDVETAQPNTPVESIVDSPTPSLQPVHAHMVRAKLPKLKVKKFHSKLEDWQEFWDDFESVIHRNGSLSNVDKFNYLRALLTGQAKSVIAGFSLTSANYESAVQRLRKRYGKNTLIKCTHIQELLTVQQVYSVRDCGRLRVLFDKIETHYHGLEALGVDEATYSDIVVPAILEKIPEVVHLTISRDKLHSDWSMNDVLTALEKEIELREKYQTNRQKEMYNGRNNGPSTGSVLNVVKQDESCVLSRETPP
ncbi:TNF receptor-associated factor 3 [Paramuricea clavata]|uniref:TNF receptor-associated factor 3 n=1 Tax=Paramuricea clavata TaxID=317549 RepID=A0A7D9HL02_PARCT|nr:TNF receptor-associated factor 3 [Paramuricea clavata]